MCGLVRVFLKVEEADEGDWEDFYKVGCMDRILVSWMLGMGAMDRKYEPIGYLCGTIKVWSVR